MPNADALIQGMLWLAVIFALLAAGIYVMRRFRGDSGEGGPGASRMLTKFRELHSQGELTDEEFRTIKTKLASEIQEELNDNDETG